MSDRALQSGHVMLLEDEALIGIALQADLEAAGYTVTGPFTTCARALDWLADHQPDLAVLDTVLKDGPCKEVALRLTRLGVPFLVYSGHAQDQTTLPALSHVTWVEKPATAQVLLTALGSLRAKDTATA